jgi:mRNA-degrading endonuclease RelE of RelBE toxin-antitoxin system
MYSYEIDEKLIRRLKKLAKKDKASYLAIQKQIIKILRNPRLGKPLHYPLAGKRRVHIGPFVLIYSINESERKVVFLDFRHHDEAYK